MINAVLNVIGMSTFARDYMIDARGICEVADWFDDVYVKNSWTRSW